MERRQKKDSLHEEDINLKASEQILKDKKQSNYEQYCFDKHNLCELEMKCIKAIGFLLFSEKPKTIEEYREVPFLIELIQSIEFLNPQFKDLKTNEVDDFIEYQILNRTLQPLSIKRRNELQSDTSQFLSQFESEKSNLRFEKLSKDAQTNLAIAIFYTKLTQDGHQVFISTQVEGHYENVILMKKQIVKTNQQDLKSFLKIRFSNIKFDQFLKDKPERDQLITFLVKFLEEHYKIDPEQQRLLVLNASEGSTVLDFQIPFSIAEARSNPISPEVIINFLLKNGVEYTPTSAIDISIAHNSSAQNFIINKDFFSPQHNMFWNERFSKMNDFRGSIQQASGLVPQKYHFPIDYTGIAINIQEFIQSDSTNWFGISSSAETWIVLFHGTNEQGIKGILDGNSIIAGRRDAYKNSKCILTGQTIKPNNIYFGDTVQTCENYTNIRFNGNSYRFIFQCRVDPQVVRCVNAYSDQKFYLVNNDDNKRIRPYRFLIKQI